MKIKSESTPNKIRRIADDLSRIRNKFDVDGSVEKLRMVANEIEHKLKRALPKKS